MVSRSVVSMDYNYALLIRGVYLYKVYKKRLPLNIHEYLLCFTEEKTIGGLWPLGFENNCHLILSA